MSTLSQLLGQIPAYDRPITLTRGSQQSGFDELGNPTFRDVMGRNFSIGAQPVQQQSAPEPVLRTILDDQGRAIHTREPAPQRSNPFAGIVDAITQGFTAPGRAARGEPVTFGDVVATAGDYGMLGAPMRAPAGALRAGAMRSADDAETPAAMVARMLREGRASEVTDDMMARVDPMEMFDLYESGATGMPMPMDEASRMARAREMRLGPDPYFGEPYYHGTDSNPDLVELGFDLGRTGEVRENYGGIHFSTDRRIAQEYGQNIIEAYLPENLARVDVENPDDVEMLTRFIGEFEGASGDELAEQVRRSHGAGIHDYSAHELHPWAQNQGAEGIGIMDVSGQEQAVVFKPNRIRSPFARFDPRLSHLANLSAGAAGGAVTLQQLMSEPNADERALREYLQALQ
jgi:hypothetical protein